MRRRALELETVRYYTFMFMEEHEAHPARLFVGGHTVLPYPGYVPNDRDLVRVYLHGDLVQKLVLLQRDRFKPEMTVLR